MLIPTRIKVGRTSYRIEQPRVMRRFGSRGDINTGEALMRVATHSNLNGQPLTSVQRSETFWHELTHGILNDMRRWDLSNNEVFVKGFSARLSHAVRSARFED